MKLVREILVTTAKVGGLVLLLFVVAHGFLWYVDWAAVDILR